MNNLIKKKNYKGAAGGVLSMVFAAIVIAFQIPVSAANTFPGQYELVSVNNIDGKGVNSPAQVSAVSYDGSKILFTSTANNLPDANSSGIYSGYIRNMNTGISSRVDKSASGVAGDKMSLYYVMSTSGRYVAFVSYATNLIDGITLTSMQRIYVKDLQTNEVSLIMDTALSGGSIKPSSISDDGRFIVTMTNSVNSIIPNTRAGSNLSSYNDPLIYDRSTNSWTVVKGSDGLPFNSRVSIDPNASCDGSLIVLSSNSNNVASGYTGSGEHVYLVDIRNGVVADDLTPGAIGDTISTNPNISCNGRYIVYSTKDRTVLPSPSGGINSAPQVVRLDRFTGERTYLTNQAYFSSYDYTAAPVSVTDAGDVVLSSGSNSSLYNRKVYFKHLSDGSGTLESVHHIYQGLNYEPQFIPTYLASSNGKYVVASSKAAEFLGLLPSSGNGSNVPSDIIRIKTGM